MCKQRINLWLKALICVMGGFLFLACGLASGFAQVAGDGLQIRSIESVQQDSLTAAWDETVSEDQDAITAQDGICDLGYYYDPSANKGAGGCRAITRQYCSENPDDSECSNIDGFCQHVPSAPICQ